MAEPVITQKAAYKVELTEGKSYAWCSCGLSKNQPFCDGAHSGTDFSPVVWKAEKTGAAYLCGCRHSGRAQFCDGAHSKL